MKNILIAGMLMSAVALSPLFAETRPTVSKPNITVESLARTSSGKITDREFDQEVVSEEATATNASAKTAGSRNVTFRTTQMLKICPVADRGDNPSILNNLDIITITVKSFSRGNEAQRPLMYLPETKEWFTYLNSDEDFSLVARQRVDGVRILADSQTSTASTNQLVPGVVRPTQNYKTFGTWGHITKSGIAGIMFCGRQSFSQPMLQYQDLDINTLPKVTVFVFDAVNYTPIENAQVSVTPKDKHNQCMLTRNTNKYGVAGFRAPKGAKFSVLVPGGEGTVDVKKDENYVLILVQPKDQHIMPVPSVGTTDPDYTR